MKTFEHVTTFLRLNKYDGPKLWWSCKIFVACQQLPEVKYMYPANCRREGKRIYQNAKDICMMISHNMVYVKTRFISGYIHLHQVHKHNLLSISKTQKQHAARLLFIIVTSIVLEYQLRRNAITKISFYCVMLETAATH